MSRAKPSHAIPFCLAAAAAMLVAAGTASAATPAIPIPSLEPTSLPAFQRSAPNPAPITGIPPTPQNPFMAPNDDSTVHNDAWQTDTYRRPGPLGHSPRVFSTLIGRVCITLTFDSRGRIVATCTGVTGVSLYMLDADSLATLATLRLPFKPQPGTNPLTNTTGGAYFYLDHRDRAVVATSNSHVWVVAERGGAAHPSFERVQDYDLTPRLGPDERVASVLPDWEGNLWFVGKANGTVGVIDHDTHHIRSVHLDEEIENSFATAEEAVYIATDTAMYRFGRRLDGTPRVDWRAGYDNVGIVKPGQFAAGTGTTPTVLPGGYVAITDNADPMQVVVYRTATELGPGESRVVCEQPVFRRGASDTENSLIGVGDSLIVENNYGYVITSTLAGRLTSPGLARVDILPGGSGCELAWTNRTERAPSVVAKVSLPTGMVYTYTKDRDPLFPVTDLWRWTTINFNTGKTVWKRTAGTGLSYNNHYAGLALGPDGRSAYLGGFGGIMAIRDRR